MTSASRIGRLGRDGDGEFSGDGLADPDIWVVRDPCGVCSGDLGRYEPAGGLDIPEGPAPGSSDVSGVITPRPREVGG